MAPVCDDGEDALAVIRSRLFPAATGGDRAGQPGDDTVRATRVNVLPRRRHLVYRRNGSVAHCAAATSCCYRNQSLVSCLTSGGAVQL